MSPSVLAQLIEQRCGLQVAPELAERLLLYLELLLRWNQRTNLTAIRDPEQIAVRHLGESLQCSRALPSGVRLMLDFGSGAGFPGAVCALARPELAVTLAESQGKKAGFLRELVRVLDLSAKVFEGRVQSLPASARFDVVALRAVDDMEAACTAALDRVVPGGWLAAMTTAQGAVDLGGALPQVRWSTAVAIEGSRDGVIAMAQKPA